AVAMGQRLRLRAWGEDSSRVSANILRYLRCRDLTPEASRDVPLRAKIKRPPARAARGIPGNNQGFFGVGVAVAGGGAAGRVAGAAGRGAGGPAPGGRPAGPRTRVCW